MELDSCIMGRRSIRMYKRGKVSDEVIRYGLELANAAPSAGNLQAREFVIVRDPQIRRGLSAAAMGQPQPQIADVTVVFCANMEIINSYGRRGRDLYVLQDVAAAIQNFLLYIHSQGLGAVWIGAFDEEGASKVLSLPAHVRPLAIVPVGLPGEVTRPPRKRPIEEMIHWEKWED